MMEIKNRTVVIFNLFNSVAFILASSCIKMSYVATRFKRELSTRTMSGRVSCTWNIRPAYGVRKATETASGYYLVIYWNRFNIKDKMPECHDSYMEIKIGKSDHSLGRFCSKNTNIRYPFKIYSPDGYASITFKVDLRKSGGIQLTYLLKRKKYGSTHCMYSYISHRADEANIYSPGWPILGNAASCLHKIDSSLSKYTKIVFMDFDMPGNSFCNYLSHGVEIRGSTARSDFSSSTIIMKKRCGFRYPFTIVTDYRYVYIRFYGGSGSYFDRGYMAGILKYGERESHSSSGNTSSLVGGLIGLGVLIIIGLVTFVCIRKRLARRRAARMQGATAPYSDGAVTVQTQLNPTVPPQGAPVSHPPGPPPSYDQAVKTHGGYQPVPAGPDFEYPPAAYPGPVVKPPPPGSSYPPPGPLPYPETQGAPYPPEMTAPYPTSYAAQYPPANAAQYPPANAAPYPTTTQDQIPGSNHPPAFAPGYGASAPPS